LLTYTSPQFVPLPGFEITAITVDPSETSRMRNCYQLSYKNYNNAAYSLEEVRWEFDLLEWRHASLESRVQFDGIARNSSRAAINGLNVRIKFRK
jgi:hypothetical protein